MIYITHSLLCDTEFVWPQIVEMQHNTTNQCLLTQCIVSDAALIQIWSLPRLDLMHEVACAPDVKSFIQMVSQI